MQLAQADVSAAYLHGDLEEEIYMTPPLGSTDICWRLQRPLYGLKQAGYNWRVHIDKTICSMGFHPTDSDPGLYYKHTDAAGHLSLIVLHVDDMLVASDTEKDMAATLAGLQDQYKIKIDTNPSWLLHMRIHRDKTSGAIKLDQEAYAREILQTFGVESEHTSTTASKAGDTPKPQKPPKFIKLPQPAGQYLSASTDDEVKRTEPALVKRYQEIVGSLAYLATHTRPDLTYATTQLARHLQKPCERHLEAAAHALRYLASHPSLGLTFSPTPSFPRDHVSIVGYSDANFGGDQDRHSIAAHCFYADETNLLMWTAHRLRHVTTSTEETELSAGSEAAHEALALRSIFVQLHLLPSTSPVSIRIDNKPTVDVATNLSYYAKLKHLDIRHKFLAEAHNDHMITVSWCPSSEQRADFLTKPHPAPVFLSLQKHFVN
jgi:hypothetical protein